MKRSSFMIVLGIVAFLSGIATVTTSNAYLILVGAPLITFGALTTAIGMSRWPT